MFVADKIFKEVKDHLPAISRGIAQLAFRRLVRQYLVYKGGKSLAPGNKASTRILISENLVFTGGRWRKVARHIKPSWKGRGKGRPTNLPEEFLVSRLAFLWANSCRKRSSISYKRWGLNQTGYEEFMGDVLIRLQIHNHRKYLEIHSQKRRAWRSATIF